MASPTLTPWDLATSGLMTTLTGAPPLSGSLTRMCIGTRSGLAAAWLGSDRLPDPFVFGLVLCTALQRDTWILPVSNVTPGAAWYGLANVILSRLPEGHISTMATRVSRPRGTRTAAKSQLALLREARACGVGSECLGIAVGVTVTHQLQNLMAISLRGAAGGPSWVLPPILFMRPDPFHPPLPDQNNGWGLRRHAYTPATASSRVHPTSSQ